jgi:transcriptional regulator with XRE-family HTH domain
MATLNPVVRRFARNLKRARQAAGLTQAAVAREARLARPYLVQLERAKRQPSIVTVVKLAKVLGVPVTDLLE